MNGHTRCPHCLRIVKVTDGKMNRHVPDHYEKTCEGFKQEALWIEKYALNANGRNRDGVCMRCHRHIDNGVNFDCHQCCFERRNDCLSYDQKVQATVDRLKQKGARVRVKRRKLAHREKTYLELRADGTHNTYLTLVMPLIHKDFPEAYMTSGSFTPEPWASDPHMNITVSLDPR
jgi:hypothetical protein